MSFSFLRVVGLCAVVNAAALCLSLSGASAEDTTPTDPSLGNTWPKFNGVYLRMKGGGLIELPKLKGLTWDKDADIYYRFHYRGKPKEKEYMHSTLVLDPKEVAKVPVVDATQIEALVFQGTRFSRMNLVHKAGDYFDDPNGQRWEPIKRSHAVRSDGKPMQLPQDWPSLFLYSEWGESRGKFRTERGPNGATAFYLSNKDITKWTTGRWMPGGWKKGDPQDVPARAFVLDHGTGRYQYRVFRTIQQPLD